MVMSLEKLEEIQSKISEQVDVSKKFDINKIKTVAGFDVAFFQDKAVCSAVVFDIKSNKIVEKKHIVAKTPMPYIPGFLAFREGPLITQVYYDLETDPDVLILDGHGIAHQRKCGLATYVGIELNKPSIGVAKNLFVGETKDSKILVDNEVRGAIVQTKQHANPLYVSPGHLIDIESSAELARMLVFPPHKLPEPLHEAHKLAKKTAIKLNGGIDADEQIEEDEETEQERLEKEFGVNSGSIV